jgi:hypothetical protein
VKCTLVTLLTLFSNPIQKIEIIAGVDMLLEERVAGYKEGCCALKSSIDYAEWKHIMKRSVELTLEEKMSLGGIS